MEHAFLAGSVRIEESFFDAANASNANAANASLSKTTQLPLPHPPTLKSAPPVTYCTTIFTGAIPSYSSSSSYTVFCLGFKIRKSRGSGLVTQNGFQVQDCMVCPKHGSREIVHCQRYPLRKPKLSRNEDILSEHFSVLNFCLVFFLFLLLGGFYCFWVAFFLQWLDNMVV